MKIIVLPQGWVMVGEVAVEGATLRLDKGAVIRRWGTSHGLGELINGPTEETVFDPITGVVVCLVNVLFQIEVEEEPWKSQLQPTS